MDDEPHMYSRLESTTSKTCDHAISISIMAYTGIWLNLRQNVHINCKKSKLSGIIFNCNHLYWNWNCSSQSTAGIIPKMHTGLEQGYLFTGCGTFICTLVDYTES